MKTLDPRSRALLYIGLSVFALMLLSISLNQLSLEPGSPMSFQQIAPDLVNESVNNDWLRNLITVFRVLLIAAWVTLPFLLIIIFLNKEARKKFLRDLMMFIPILILIYLLTRMRNNEQGEDLLNLPGQSLEQMGIEEMTPSAPMPEFSAPPDWVTTVTSLLLAVAITLIVIFTVVAIWRRMRLARAEPIGQVQKEAQAAIDAIEAGGDLRDTIMHCYYQMLKATSEYRNIQRGSDMTPHEFETFLESRGLPATPVHSLTQLFEQVRYGTYRPGRQDERAAIASLSAIVSACQRVQR